MSQSYYATTPIYYVNAEPHLGHAYTTTLTDIVSRYHRLLGDDTYFLTGTDEHGEKIQQSADALGITPQELTDQVSQRFYAIWQDLNISNDDFIRTTEPRHKKVVQDILQQVYDKGDIVYGEYGGLYCVKCERFYTEKELDENGLCPQHLIPPEERFEANYFFKMEKYRLWLQEFLEENPDFIRPSSYRNEVLGMLREPIGDLSISRPKSRISWGIELPWDTDHVTYVWFDALINYYSALQSKDLVERYWHSVEHFIAKDILKPHAVFWPTMLKAAGLPLYQHLNVHGYWLIDGGKMSKSQGNVVRPLDLKDKYGLDAFRYFLARDMTFGLDANFSEVALVERVNADLANDLGNLLNRTLGMLGKYRDGIIPKATTEAHTEAHIEDAELIQHFSALQGHIREQLAKVRIDKLLEHVLEAVRYANKYIADTQPWKLAKDDSQQARLDTVLYNCLEALRIAAVALEPVIPSKSQELLNQLGLAHNFTAAALAWGGTEAGTQTQKGEPLFPRIDMAALQAALQEAAAEASDTDDKEATEVVMEHKEEITIDDFAKLELRVAEVVKCENHPKADKLLVLIVKLGSEERTIVSGIRQWYEAEAMVGKKVIIVANLKPVKLRGILSQGMILSAEDSAGNLSVSALDRDIASGSEVR